MFQITEFKILWVFVFLDEDDSRISDRKLTTGCFTYRKILSGAFWGITEL